MNSSLKKYLSRNQLIVGIVLLLVILIIYILRRIIVILFVAYIIVAALAPLVMVLRQRNIPKLIAVLLPYIIIIAVPLILLIPNIPTIGLEIISLSSTFITNLEPLFANTGFVINLSDIQNFITARIETIGGNLVLLTGQVVTGIVTFISIVVISIYLLLDKDRVYNSFSRLFSRQYRIGILEIMDESEKKLGGWVRGQLVVSFTVGFLTWVALSLIGLDYALPLAFIAGIFEILPTIGLILSLLPALVVAFGVSSATGFTVLGAYILIQLIEANFIIPKVMQRSIGIHPLLIIIGIIVGSEVMGLVGAILSVPLISLILVIYDKANNMTAEKGFIPASKVITTKDNKNENKIKNPQRNNLD